MENSGGISFQIQRDNSLPEKCLPLFAYFTSWLDISKYIVLVSGFKISFHPSNFQKLCLILPEKNIERHRIIVLPRHTSYFLRKLVQTIKSMMHINYTSHFLHPWKNVGMVCLFHQLTSWISKYRWSISRLTKWVISWSDWLNQEWNYSNSPVD